LLGVADFDDCFFPPRQDEDSPPPPPIPRKSFIECDFQKDKVDILTVHRYLSERCLRTEGGHIGSDGIFVPDHMASDERVSSDILIPAPAGTLSKFKEMITNDARAIDPEQLDLAMHENAPILQLDEQVQMAYKAGRDVSASESHSITCCFLWSLTRLSHITHTDVCRH
jgi:hypothetical protein